MTDDAVSVRRTPLGGIVLRADPIQEAVIDALAVAWLDDDKADELEALLRERGRALRALDSDQPRRRWQTPLPDLAGNLADICTHADLGWATTPLDTDDARRLHHQLGNALHHTERNAA